MSKLEHYLKIGIDFFAMRTAWRIILLQRYTLGLPTKWFMDIVFIKKINKYISQPLQYG